MPKLPEQFLNSLEGLEQFNRSAFVEAHAADQKLTSVRLNPFKQVNLDFPLSEKVAWARNGFYLEERPYFTHDPLFHAGCYYVQEPGSMFLETAMEQSLELERPLKILDACGAPGGKSTLVNSLINANSLLVSNEVVKARSSVLAVNLARWGTSNTIVTNSETARLGELEEYFDALVVDAPCSGSGLFRKQPEAIDEWSPAAVQACSVRQKNILREVLPALKSGGRLFYSTCSYSPEENEDIVSWLIKEFGMGYFALRLDPAWGLVDTGLGYRFYPHLVKSEGFFMAVLTKQGENGSQHSRRQKFAAKPERGKMELLRGFIGDSDNIVRARSENRFHLLSSAADEFLSTYEKEFYFRKAGTVIGEIKGRDLVPDQELSWSLSRRQDLETLDLTRENAISYLKKKEFPLTDTSTGLRLISYKGQGIGWAKALSRRLNNYLPSELRILR